MTASGRPAGDRADTGPAWCHWDGDTLTLRLRVQPRARQDSFDTPLGDALRVRLQAPPVDGKANSCLVAFLAKAFGVPKQRVTIIGGERSRNKVLRIVAPSRLPSSIPAP